jgi:hypothetical protein
MEKCLAPKAVSAASLCRLEKTFVPYSTLCWYHMVASALRHLTPEGRALLKRRIESGQFRSELEFEEFAIRAAISRMQWDELRRLRADKPPPRYSDEQILREVRKVRRAVARKHGP